MPRAARRSSALPIDLRGLMPPEPLQRILDALEGEGPWRFLLAREPYPLYAILRGDGWRYRVRKDAEGVELVIERAEMR